MFVMVQDHHWSWSDLQQMTPFERDIYVILLKDWVTRKKEERKKQSQALH